MRTILSALFVACAAVAIAGCSLLRPSDQVRAAPADLAARLEQRVSVNFKDVPLDRVVSDLARRNNVNVVLDNGAFRILPVPADANLLHRSGPYPPPPVTLNLRNAKLGHVFNWLCRVHSLAYAIQDNTLVLSAKETLPGPDLAQSVIYDSECQRLFDALSGQAISVDSTSAAIGDVADMLGKKTGLNFVVGKDEPCSEKLRLTVHLSDVTLSGALDRICAAARLRYTVADDAIFIAAADAVRAIDRVRTLAPDPEETKRLSAILKNPVSFDFVAAPIDDVLAFFRHLEKINMVLDKRSIEGRGNLDVTLRLEKTPLEESLEWIVRMLDLGYVAREGVIFVSTRERLAKPESSPTVIVNLRGWDKRIAVVMDQPISFDFIATPLDDVVGFLRGITRTSVVVDKQALAGRDPLDVTLKVDKVRFSSALTWICRTLDLAWTVKDGTIFISTPDRVVQAIEGK